MRMTIEKALEWAYREELPKSEPDWAAIGLTQTPMLAHASGPLEGFLSNPSEAVEPRMNGWGVVAVKTLFGHGPHVDALRIGDAVKRLCDDAVVMAGMAPPALGGVADDLWQDAYARAAARLPRRLRDIIIRRALTGDAGHWSDEPVQVVPVTHDNGRPRWYRMVEREAVTWDGRKTGAVERVEMIVDKRGRRRYPDSYQKYRLEPDPVWMIEARAVYLAWRAALDVLFEDMNGRLERLTLLPSDAPREPWLKACAA